MGHNQPLFFVSISGTILTKTAKIGKMLTYA